MTHKPWARNIADFPLPAVPDPLPPGRLNMGAFFSISGNIRNLIFEPRMYTFSSCPTWPSRYVTVIFCIWQFILSSASISLPRYTSPVFVSQVMIWPSASWSTLMGTPIDIVAEYRRNFFFFYKLLEILVRYNSSKIFYDNCIFRFVAVRLQTVLTKAD